MTSDRSARTVTITLDTNIFALETVKKAAYRYLDRFAVDLKLDGAVLTCRLCFPDGTSDSDAEAAVRDLKNEVLDQDLRERIRVETAPIRNLILAHAFSKTGLIADEQVSGD